MSEVIGVEETKTCTKCGEVKARDRFSKSAREKDGLQAWCKDCRGAYREENREKRKEYNKAYEQGNKEKTASRKRKHYQENKERILTKSKDYRNENKEKIAGYRSVYNDENREARSAYNKEHFQQNKERYLRARRERYRRDPSTRIAQSLRARIYAGLKGERKTKATAILLGCSFDELKEHIESKFKPGMGWDNYGINGWHIDHIKPCASFNLRNKEEQEECFHYTNLQPLWAEENMSKGASVCE